MWLRLLLVIAMAALAGACAGATHELPLVDQASLDTAKSEVANNPGKPRRHYASDREVHAAIDAAVDRVRPAATRLCLEMAIGTCDWHIVISNDRSLNASAGANGTITVNRGIVEYAADEEEIAMVIAHEMGHQAANHRAGGQRNAITGALIGGVLMGALGAIASVRSPSQATIATQGALSGASLGASIGHLSYSKEQEREADYLSALILYRAGVDLDKARGFLVTMARASGHKDTGMLDTHPAGPERLAAWDKAVQEIRASHGAVPKPTS